MSFGPRSPETPLTPLPGLGCGEQTLFLPLRDTPPPSFQEGRLTGGGGISTFPSGSFCLPRFGVTVLAAQSFLVTGVEGLHPSGNPCKVNLRGYLAWGDGGCLGGHIQGTFLSTSGLLMPKKKKKCTRSPIFLVTCSSPRWGRGVLMSTCVWGSVSGQKAPDPNSGDLAHQGSVIVGGGALSSAGRTQ